MKWVNKASGRSQSRVVLEVSSSGARWSGVLVLAGNVLPQGVRCPATGSSVSGACRSASAYLILKGREREGWPAGTLAHTHTLAADALSRLRFSRRTRKDPVLLLLIGSADAVSVSILLCSGRENSSLSLLPPLSLAKEHIE